MNERAAPPTTPATRVINPSSCKMRWVICALLFWVTSGNYTLAASVHQAWSANVLSLVGDMFPRRVVGFVTGFASMVSAFGSMGLFFIAGRVLSVSGTYIPIFILASLACPLGLLSIHLLAPKLDPAEIDVEKKLRKLLRKMAVNHALPIT